MNGMIFKMVYTKSIHFFKYSYGSKSQLNIYANILF